MDRKRQTSARDGLQALLRRLEDAFEQERDKSVKPLYPIAENGGEIKLPRDLEKRSELGKTVLAKPFVIVVEAKRNDFEQGWAQCLAELIAAQKLNGEPQRPVHGIVTDGKLWEFGKLVEATLLKNVESYTIDHLPRLCAVLNAIFQATLDGESIMNGVAP